MDEDERRMRREADEEDEDEEVGDARSNRPKSRVIKTSKRKVSAAAEHRELQTPDESVESMDEDERRMRKEVDERMSRARRKRGDRTDPTALLKSRF
ncbi:MAG: hypothetical protein M1840_008349 [Geoglossum simile]|nr:MAG: hypothetical protein M1840_008349 [Geoglossum simile]